MGNIGWTGIIIIAILVVILFGKGKISSIMGDLAKGLMITHQKTKIIRQITLSPITSNLKCHKLVG